MGCVMSMLSIIIAVGALIVVNSIMKGFEKEFVNKTIGMTPHVTLFTTINDDKKQSLMKNFPNITYLQEGVVGQGLLSNESLSNSTGILIKGIDIEDYLNKIKIKCRMCNFSEIKKDEFSVVIGSELSSVMRVGVGDYLSIMVPSMRSTVFGMLPKQKKVKVAGVVKFGLSNLDSSVILMNIEGAKILFKDVENALTTDVNITEPMNANYYGLKIARFLNLNGFSTWKDSNIDIVEAIQIESAVMYLLMSLFVLISMFSILATITMLVQDKRKNIAILSSMGMSPIEIGHIFFISGFFIAGISTVIGTLLGVAFARNIEIIRSVLENIFGVNMFNSAVYFLSNLPVYTAPKDIFATCMLCFIFGVLVSIFPAIKATRVKASESLRYF